MRSRRNDNETLHRECILGIHLVNRLVWSNAAIIRDCIFVHAPSLHAMFGPPLSTLTYGGAALVADHGMQPLS